MQWTVTGTNDAPVVSGAVLGTATEDAMTSSIYALANASDIDANTTLQVTDIQANLPAGVTYNAANKMFSLDPTNAAYQSLAANQTTTVIVNYKVYDGITKTDASVQWTVIGTNDAAILVTANSLLTGAVTEDDFNKQKVSGIVTITDADTGEAVFKPVTDTAKTGLYGSFSFNETTGAWTYTLNKDSLALQKLAQGQLVTQTLTVQSFDGTLSQDIVVNITGSADINDGAEVTYANNDNIKLAATRLN